MPAPSHSFARAAQDSEATSASAARSPTRPGGQTSARIAGSPRMVAQRAALTSLRTPGPTRDTRPEPSSSGVPVLQGMFTFDVSETDYTVSNLTYQRPSQGNNLIHRSKDYKHVTADVSKRAITSLHAGKRLDEFGKSLVFQAQSYQSMPSRELLDHFNVEHPQGVGKDVATQTMTDLGEASNAVWEMADAFAQAEAGQPRDAAAFKLTVRIHRLLKLMDDARDQFPLATVYDPAPQNHDNESMAVKRLEGDLTTGLDEESALWGLFDAKALAMVMDAEDDEALGDLVHWLDVKALRESEAGTLENRPPDFLKAILGAYMLRNHIQLMKATFGEVAQVISSEQSITEMLQHNNGLGPHAAALLEAYNM